MATTYITGGTHTRTVAARERTHLWRRHVTDNHGRLDFAFASPDAFAGSTRVQRCGDLQLVEFWSDPVRYDRRPSAADRDSDDSVRLLLPLSGNLLVSGPSADRRLAPGLAAAVSMAAGFRLGIPGRIGLEDTTQLPDGRRAHTISHVAHASGFGSLSAFNSAFRSHFGRTPADLRAGNSPPDPPDPPAARRSAPWR